MKPGCLSLLLCAGFLPMHFGCRDAREHSTGKIFGGRPSAPSDWLGAVALLSYQSVDCSGVMVHPRLVITAAHCVEGADPSLEVYMGAGDDTLPLDGQSQVERIGISPLFGEDPKGFHDIAYVLLKEPLPIPDEALIPILSDPQEKSAALQPGQAVTIVGFGERESGDFGRKYEADLTITSLNDNEVRMGGQGKDACTGDSGGPAYIQLKNGAFRVFGVVSRGRACGQGGVWSRIDADLCWIVKDSGLDLNLPAGTC